MGLFVSYIWFGHFGGIPLLNHQGLGWGRYKLPRYMDEWPCYQETSKNVMKPLYDSYFWICPWIGMSTYKQHVMQTIDLTNVFCQILKITGNIPTSDIHPPVPPTLYSHGVNVDRIFNHLPAFFHFGTHKIFATVDGRKPKQPPGMYKTL